MALAYEGLSQQMSVFPCLPEGMSTLGLLQSVPQVYKEREEQVSYNFLHYTVQEYLAALHLSHLEPQEQMAIIDTKCLRKNKTKHSNGYYEAMQFKTTFQFLAGITGLAAFSVDFLSNQLSQDAATMYRWFYESQNLPVLTNVLGSGERRLSLSYSATTTDYFIAGYCLAHSNCTWKIALYHISVDDVSVKSFSKGCNYRLSVTDISSKIVSASFSNGSITADGIQHFLTIPNLVLQHIQHLNLHGNKLDRRACDRLVKGVRRMPTLKRLDLSHNQLIGCGNAVSSLHSSKLSDLDMSLTGISDPDFECIASYIHSTTSLESLDIGWNDISVESVDSLCKALSANSSMKTLKMRGCHLTKSHYVYLSQLLRYPIHCKIENLDLSIANDGVGEIMSGMSNNHTLKVLRLRCNHIGSEGVVAIATMLKENSLLEKLYLDGCRVDSSGGVELGAALVRNKTLRKLGLSESAIDDGVRGLCAELEKKASLEVLNLRADRSLGEGKISLLLKCVEQKNKRLTIELILERYNKDVTKGYMPTCMYTKGAQAYMIIY